MKDYLEIRADLGRNMGQLRHAMPDTLKGFGQLFGAGMGAGALDVKQKELIALAIAVTVRCDGCIASHVDKVIKAGASRDELVETIGVAIVMGGGPATVYGADALQCFDQMTAARADA